MLLALRASFVDAQQDPVPPPAGAVPGTPPPAPPEKAWVRAELRVNVRASPSPTSTPLFVVMTGDEVIVTERRGTWARVERQGTGTGWLPASYLEPQPPPVEHVAQLDAELRELRERLAAAERERDLARGRNEQLDARERDREAELQQLRDDNRVLRAGERWPYLVTGASILGAGMVAGALVRGWSSRRMGPRIRF
jgi:hypothetical protein